MKKIIGLAVLSCVCCFSGVKAADKPLAIDMAHADEIIKKMNVLTSFISEQKKTEDKDSCFRMTLLSTSIVGGIVSAFLPGHALTKTLLLTVCGGAATFFGIRKSSGNISSKWKNLEKSQEGKKLLNSVQMNIEDWAICDEVAKKMFSSGRFSSGELIAFENIEYAELLKLKKLL